MVDLPLSVLSVRPSLWWHENSRDLTGCSSHVPVASTENKVGLCLSSLQNNSSYTARTMAANRSHCSGFANYFWGIFAWKDKYFQCSQCWENVISMQIAAVWREHCNNNIKVSIPESEIINWTCTCGFIPRLLQRASCLLSSLTRRTDVEKPKINRRKRTNIPLSTLICICRHVVTLHTWKTLSCSP